LRYYNPEKFSRSIIMPTRKIFTPNAPRPLGPYSQAIVTGNTVYVAGQGGFDPATMQLQNATFEEEVAQTLENIKAILAAAGATLRDVVNVNVYLSDLNNFARLNEIYKQYFQEDFPARATVGAALLGGTQIEVACVAVVEG
jgi:2-iminobutanoate/2-iminopropanoate deaminase